MLARRRPTALPPPLAVCALLAILAVPLAGAEDPGPVAYNGDQVWVRGVITTWGPSNLTASWTSDDTIRIDWLPPGGEVFNATLAGFQIRHFPGSSPMSPVSVTMLLDPDATSLNFTGLEMGSQHAFSVSALFEGGVGFPFTESVPAGPVFLPCKFPVACQGVEAGGP